jgi:hypothetical protein
MILLLNTFIGVVVVILVFILDSLTPISLLCEHLVPVGSHLTLGLQAICIWHFWQYRFIVILNQLLIRCLTDLKVRVHYFTLGEDDLPWTALPYDGRLSLLPILINSLSSLLRLIKRCRNCI